MLLLFRSVQFSSACSILNTLSELPPIQSRQLTSPWAACTNEWRYFFLFWLEPVVQNIGLYHRIKCGQQRNMVFMGLCSETNWKISVRISPITNIFSMENWLHNNHQIVYLVVQMRIQPKQSTFWFKQWCLTMTMITIQRFLPFFFDLVISGWFRKTNQN